MVYIFLEVIQYRCIQNWPFSSAAEKYADGFRTRTTMAAQRPSHEVDVAQQPILTKVLTHKL
jgi:hypothetical protein